MSRVPTVAFYCQASATVGFGHLNRCLVLAGALRRMGMAVTFVMPASSPAATARVSAARFATETALVAHADVVVVDDYDVDAAALSDLSTGRALCLIDDLGERSLVGVSVLLNQNLNRPMYTSTTLTRQLLGPRYALVRDEFLAARLSPRQQGARILITCGASDPRDAARRVFEIICSMPEWDEITVLRGPGAAHQDAWQRLARVHERLRFVDNPPNVAEVFCRADVVVTAAGSTCYELAALGIPFVTVVAADNQRAVAAPLAEAGLAPCAGTVDALDQELMRSLTRALLASDDRPRRSSALRDLVDARGAERVSAALLPLVGVEHSVVPLDPFDDERVETLVALDRAAIHEQGAAYSNVPWNRHSFQKALTGKTELSCCVTVSDEPVGFWVASATLPGTCHTHRVFLRAEKRGRGLAQQLFGRVRDQAALLGLQQMTLEVGYDNVHAERFYLSLGFERLDGISIRRYLAARGRTATVGTDFLRETDGSTFMVLSRPV